MLACHKLRHLLSQSILITYSDISEWSSEAVLLLLPAAERGLRLRLNVLLQMLLEACKVLLVGWVLVDIVSGEAWQRLNA